MIKDDAHPQETPLRKVFLNGSDLQISGKKESGQKAAFKFEDAGVELLCCFFDSLSRSTLLSADFPGFRPEITLGIGLPSASHSGLLSEVHRCVPSVSALSLRSTPSLQVLLFASTAPDTCEARTSPAGRLSTSKLVGAWTEVHDRI